MLKKIILGMVVFGLLAVLGIGAMIRTMDRTSTYSGDQGQGRGRAYDTRAPAADTSELPRWGQQTQTYAPTTALGVVVSVNEEALTVKLADDSLVVIEGRLWRFAQEQKFSAQAGDQVKVTGFSYNNKFEIVRIENLTNGKIVQLRNEYGQPMWSGRAQRGE